MALAVQHLHRWSLVEFTGSTHFAIVKSLLWLIIVFIVRNTVIGFNRFDAGRPLSSPPLKHRHVAALRYEMQHRNAVFAPIWPAKKHRNKPTTKTSAEQRQSTWIIATNFKKCFYCFIYLLYIYSGLCIFDFFSATYIYIRTESWRPTWHGLSTLQKWLKCPITEA